jgi:hypothetical protein
MDQPLQPIALSRSLTLAGAASRHQGSAGSARGRATQRASAGFIAQLLAARHGAAAYRQRRRCTPEEARSAYLTASALQPTPAAHVSIAA